MTRSIGLVAQDVRYEQDTCQHCALPINRLRTRHIVGRWQPRDRPTELSGRREPRGTNHELSAR